MSRVPYVADTELAAERAVVGIALAFPERLQDAELEPGHFTVPLLKTAWRAAQALSAQGKPVDPITVSEEMGQDHTVALSELVLEVPTGGNLGYYCQLVRQAARRRDLGLALGRAAELARQLADPDAVVDAVLRDLAAIDQDAPRETLPVKAILRERYLEIEAIADARAKGLPASTGVPTGLGSLDDMLGGLQIGVVTVAAGRPGHGKSALGQACVRYAAASGVGCHVFSLEDTRSAYADRILAGGSGISADRLRAVNLGRGDLSRLSAALDAPSRTPWLIDDRSGITAGELVRSVRRSARDNGTRLVVVDYVQLVRGQRGQDAYTRISEAINELADAAKHDKMAYLVLAQLNRDCERRDDKRPMLSDLKASGTIEERAKCVLLLYRPALYDEALADDCIEIRVAKNNQGPLGSVRAAWHGPTIRMGR